MEGQVSASKFELNVCLQEPLLAFPHRYLQMMGPIPSEPRPVVSVLPSKKEAYLKLASILLAQRVTTRSTERSVKFLVSLCTDMTPQPVADLPWFQGGSISVDIDVMAPSSLARLCPVMKFVGKLNR